ncbi:MAG: DNA repair protein RecO [Ruminococcaceae bacterium]|nr:DNA repair protein RecO [Oscillospiraceae bacterium]
MVTKKERMTSDGLVVREMNVGENDKLLTILTRDFGIIKAFSSGSKKITSKKFSASSLLSFASFSFVKVGDTYKIYEAQPIKSFFDVGSDVYLLGIAQYFCELAVFNVPSDFNGDEYLRLFLNSLHFLVDEKRDAQLIKAITELRLAVISGYMPDLVACFGCSEFEADIMYFDLSDGKLYCEKCKGNIASLLPVDRTVLSAMRHIVFSKFNNIYNFEIPTDKAAYLSKLTEKYICAQTEHNYKTLDFLTQIRM